MTRLVLLRDVSYYVWLFVCEWRSRAIVIGQCYKMPAHGVGLVLGRSCRERVTGNGILPNSGSGTLLFELEGISGPILRPRDCEDSSLRSKQLSEWPARLSGIVHDVIQQRGVEESLISGLLGEVHRFFLRIQLFVGSTKSSLSGALRILYFLNALIRCMSLDMEECSRWTLAFLSLEFWVLTDAWTSILTCTSLSGLRVVQTVLSESMPLTLSRVRFAYREVGLLNRFGVSWFTSDLEELCWIRSISFRVNLSLLQYRFWDLEIFSRFRLVDN